MESTPQKNSPSEEVDFTQFFSWVGRGFSRIGKSFVYFLALLRNVFFSNKRFFTIIIVAGLILGVVYSEFLKKDYYKSSMILGCDYLNEMVLKNMIDKFNLLTREPGGEGLAQLLKIDAASAKSILSFEFKKFVSEEDVIEVEVLREQLNNLTTQKKELVEDIIERIEIDNANAYEITVLVYDPHTTKALQQALVNYFQNNEYVKRRMEVTRENMRKRKEKLERDSKKMDSLKIALYQSYHLQSNTSTRGTNKVVVSDEIADPLDVFKEDLELNKEILKLENKLYVEPDFEVVDGFATFKEPDSAGLVEILFYSFLISWVIGYLIIGAWKFDRMLANYNLNKD